MCLRQLVKGLWKRFSQFSLQERGNMSMITGLAIIPLVVSVGAAVDYERAANARTELLASLDTAALYAASLSFTDNATLTTKSLPFLSQNYTNNSDAQVSNFAIVNSGTTVTASATVTLTTYFMAIVGKTTLAVNGTATVQKSGVNLEVALVLDNTNSMNSTNAQTGNTAIADLKTASAKFINTVVPDTQGLFYTKVSEIPYNNSVNLGTSALAAAARGAIASGTSTSPGYTNYTFSTHESPSNQRTLAITNCVTERTGAQAYTDAAIATYPVGRAYLPSGNPCNATALQGLTTDKTALLNTITNMSAGGSTAGQVGIAWGWYSLSPIFGYWTGNSIPAGYDKLTTPDLTQRVKKVMVLMTDGEYNSAMCNGVITGNDPVLGSAGNPYYMSVVGSGSPADHINCAPTNGDVYTQANSDCAAIKTSGVEVFVITFQLDKTYPKRVALVNNCATDASHVVDADTTSLDAAFSNIANQILAMRIAS